MTKSIPEGWRSVTPRIVVPDVEKLIDFLKYTFGATGEFREAMPSEIKRFPRNLHSDSFIHAHMRI